MANPVSGSPTTVPQALPVRKQVTWGHNTVVVIEPSYYVPKGCSKENETLLTNLMNARSILARSLLHPKSRTNQLEALPILRGILSSVEANTDSTDSIAQTIYRVSHVFLAITYLGKFSKAFLKEREIIDRDSEMKKYYDQWKPLLTAESIFP